MQSAPITATQDQIGRQHKKWVAFGCLALTGVKTENKALKRILHIEPKFVTRIFCNRVSQ
jgi:hypothetical protein